MTELVFDYNGRIKQERINRFVNLLSEYFTHNHEVKIENIKTEDFNDLFESVIKKVVVSKSEKKMIRFRDILIKELNIPSKETELTSLYLDLIETLTEEELMILERHSNFTQDYYNRLNQQSNLKSELSKIQKELDSKTYLNPDNNHLLAIKKLQDEIDDFLKVKESLKRFNQAKTYNLIEPKFMFFKQRLYSKGLLLDEGIGRIDIRAFEMMMITDFGKEFINFIET